MDRLYKRRVNEYAEEMEEKEKVDEVPQADVQTNNNLNAQPMASDTKKPVNQDAAQPQAENKAPKGNSPRPNKLPQPPKKLPPKN